MCSIIYRIKWHNMYYTALYHTVHVANHSNLFKSTHCINPRHLPQSYKYSMEIIHMMHIYIGLVEYSMVVFLKCDSYVSK